MRIIDVAIKLYEVTSMYSELEDVKSMLVPVVRELFRRAEEVCK